MLERIEPVVQPYAWGSATAIPSLLGTTPTGKPQAEAWYGAHPGGPALLVDEAGAPLGPLAAAIETDPAGALGSAVVTRFGPRLPFLVKVLAAARPLSIQVHPSPQQAAEGFAREEAAGIPCDAPQRTYRDDQHKPEVLIALEPFEAVCGFRPVREVLALLDALDLPALADLRSRLDRDGTDLVEVVSHLLRLPVEEAGPLVDALGRRAAELAARADADPVLAWVARLADEYPGDPGVVVVLLLNHLRLQPGEAVHLGPGQLHAYLRGTGVEVMAGSDNVVRGGLTPKHVDVEELVRIADPRTGRPEPLRPRPEEHSAEAVYDTPDDEFLVSRVDLQRGQVFHGDVRGPEILLCVEGATLVDDLPLGRGTARWVPAETGRYLLASPAGRATVFRVRTGLAADG